MATPPPKTLFANAGTAASTAKATRNYQMAHSKSRVANVLSKPGSVVYTNKERIDKEYKDKLVRIADSFGVPLEEVRGGLEASKTMTQKETVSTLRKLEDALEEAIAKNPKAAVITVTLTVGVAQLAYKALRLMIAMFIFVLALPLSITNMFDGLPYLLNELIPNSSFNTTRRWINWVKGKSA